MGMGCYGAVPSGTCLGPTLVLMAQSPVEQRQLVERTMQFAIVRILQLKFCSGECRREVAEGYLRLWSEPTASVSSRLGPPNSRDEATTPSGRYVGRVRQQVRWCYVAAERWVGAALRVMGAAKLGHRDKETAGFVWGARDVTHLGFVCASASHGCAFLSHRRSFTSWP